MSDKKVGLSRRLSDKVLEKSSDLIRKRLSQAMKKSKPQKTNPKNARNEVKALINNLLAL